MANILITLLWFLAGSITGAAIVDRLGLSQGFSSWLLPYVATVAFGCLALRGKLPGTKAWNPK